MRTKIKRNSSGHVEANRLKKEVAKILSESRDFNHFHEMMYENGYLYLTPEFLTSNANNSKLVLWNFEDNQVEQTSPLKIKNGDQVIVEYANTEYAPYGLLIAINWFSHGIQTILATYIKKIENIYEN